MTKVVASTALLLLISSSAFADMITFAGTSGSLSASAQFSVVGSNLQVTLTNASTRDVMVPGDVLTALFFSGVPDTLTPLSARLSAGSTVEFGIVDFSDSVGGEWAYNCGTGGQWPSRCGISSTGLGLFGPDNLFPGSNLQGPESPNGLQYGLLSLGDNPLTGNTPVTGSNALIKNSAVFRFSGLPAGFDLKDIDRVQFQYGTSLSESRIPGMSAVPEPGSLSLLASGIGLLGLGAFRRRKRTQ